MLPHSSLYYDINKEADEVSKGSNNTEYQIITVLAATVDFGLSTLREVWKRGVVVLLVIVIAIIAEKLRLYKYIGKYVDPKSHKDHEYAIYFI